MRVFANTYFFPVATVWAAIILPWSILTQFGLTAGPAGLQSHLGHAHEMLFGFALAVITGYVLGPQRRALILGLLAFWMLARVTFLLWPGGLPAAMSNVAFAVTVAYHVLPRFAKGAKKWRNKALAPLLAAIFASAALFQWLFMSERIGPLHGLLFEAVLLLSLLMFFMGGRMLAPAVAGHLMKKDRELEARLQPNIEGAVLLLMAAVLVVNLLPGEMSATIAALLLVVIASLTLVRILRWQLWHCFDRPDLLVLVLGQLWLIAGWLMCALALTTDALRLSVALHAITVGALGTLTLAVMARTRLHRDNKHYSPPAIAHVAAILISLSALVRLTAGEFTPAISAYLLATALWSTAFLILLVILVRRLPVPAWRRQP